MRAKVYQFPSQDDLNTIQMAVQAFLLTQRGITRRLMLRTIEKTLSRHGISRLNFPLYTVEVSGDKHVVIHARTLTEGRFCPNCSEPIYTVNSGVRILSVQEGPEQHTVTYGCKCGTVFGKLEPV